MAANLGLVVHAAQRDAHEAPAQGAGDRLPQGGLAHPRRAHEAEDRSFQIALQLEHGQVLEDALLDFLQVVVVLVQDLLGALDIHLAGAFLLPGQRHQPLQVGAGHGVFRGRLRDALQALQLPQGLFLHFLRHPGLLDLLPQLIDLALALVDFAQLLLDGLQLLAQHVLPLRLAELLLHVGLDLLAELKDFPLLQKLLHQPAHPQANVQGFQKLLLHLGGERGQGEGHQVGQVRAVFQVEGHRLQLVRQGGGGRHHLAEEVAQVARQGFVLRIRMAGHHIRQRLHPGPEERLLLQDFQHPHPVGALQNNEEVVVGHLDDFMHHTGDADFVEVGPGRLLQAGVALGHQRNQLVVTAERLHQLDRTLSAHRHRGHLVREQHHVPHRQNRQFFPATNSVGCGCHRLVHPLCRIQEHHTARI